MRTAHEDSPGVSFPPPFVYLGFLLLGIAMEWLWPIGLGVGGWQPWVGGLLILLGLALIVAGLLKLRRAGTSVHPNEPTVVLVTDGPWRYTRNPLYLALALIYLGIAIAAESVWAIVLIVPALFVIRYAVIGREERYLEAKFGDDYRRYKVAVRRWI